jgi:general secretion pathway protein B
MSFILDALKKSEAERQRQNAPEFSTVPDASARKSPYKWILVVALLLGINIVALMGVLYMANRGGDPAVNPEPLTAGNNDQSTSSFSDMVAEAKRTEPERSAASASDSSVTGNGAAATTQPAVSAVNQSYESFNVLRAKGLLDLPDLHLDIHVYSGDSADRFVFINMTKYRENGKLSEGPVVKQITPDGVVLDYQGTDFLLPRE